MDPELCSFLEAMEQRADAKMEAMEQRAVARDAEARHTLEAKIDEVRRQAGADRDAIIREIRALPEGLSTDQREETGRIVAAREQALLDEHILPLRASAANHEQRMQAVEGR